MNEREQLEMNFGAPATDGYAMWQWDQDQAEERIAELWNLPLGRNVYIKLVNIDEEFSGLLTLSERPLSLDRKQPLSLRLQRMKFLSNEIERCVVAPDDD